MPKLKLLAKGKVRDIYEIPGESDKLLFVATDRISAFDCLMVNVRFRAASPKHGADAE